jgi:hypothetical protein
MNDAYGQAARTPQNGGRFAWQKFADGRFVA